MSNAIKTLTKLVSEKRILILEDDFTVSSSVGNFYMWCIENKMDCNVLYNIGKLPIEYIIEQILWFDVIVFQTTWTYEIARKLEDEVIKMKSKKTIIECYIADPSYYNKPKVIHDIYILRSYGEDYSDWKFSKLKS